MPLLTNETFWLYRAGMAFWRKDNRRAIWSQTFITFEPEPSAAGWPEQTNLMVWGAQQPFYHNYTTVYGNGQAFVNRLWPKREQILPLRFRPIPGPDRLNPNAPEAAFRLQRVGAEEDRTYIGRMHPPILTDAAYTDLPHRRHIDVSLFPTSSPVLGINQTLSFTVGGRHFINCIFRRDERRYVPVTSIRLLPNPVRIWQRLSLYNPTSDPDDNATFVPDEEW